MQLVARGTAAKEAGHSLEGADAHNGLPASGTEISQVVRGPTPLQVAVVSHATTWLDPYSHSSPAAKHMTPASGGCAEQVPNRKGMPNGWPMML